MTIHVDLVGVPFDLGGGRSGARDGPEGFIRSGLMEVLHKAGVGSSYYDLRAKKDIDLQIFDTARESSGLVHYAHEVVGMAKLVGTQTRSSSRSGHIPVVLGGDHSISIGSVGGMLHPDVLLERRIGLVWIDAHFDSHTHLTTHTHRAHGLPLATLLGHGPRAFLLSANAIRCKIEDGMPRPVGPVLLPSNVIHIGAGEEHCELEEYAFFLEHRISQFSRKMLRQDGWTPAWSELKRIMDNVDLLWVSLDLDSLDRSIAPGVYYPNADGLSREEILELASVLQSSGKICGVDLMEYNPRFDKLDACGRGVTASIATEFLLQLLGV